MICSNTDAEEEAGGSSTKAAEVRNTCMHEQLMQLQQVCVLVGVGWGGGGYNIVFFLQTKRAKQTSKNTNEARQSSKKRKCVLCGI